MIPMAYEIFDSVGTVNGQAMYVLTPTIIGGKTGLANLTEGKIVASCQYDGFGRQFENGRLLMCKNGKWGFIDRNGQVVVDFTYDYHWGLLEGYAKVGKNGKAGLVDINENYLLPCEYDFVSGFSDGICRYGNGDAIKELIHPAKAGGINLYYYFSTVDVSTGKDGLPQKEWVYCDPAPYIQNGRTMVPLRIVSELCGYTVQWNGEKNTITMVSPWLAIRLAVGDNEATVNILDDRQKAKAVRLDAPPVIVDGTTMVPLRFLSENANIPVIWEDATNSVILGGR